MMLENRVALVTGGTSGIGKATALGLGVAGAKVVFSGRREPAGKATETELRDAGVDCLFVQSDVSNEAEIKTLVQTTVEKYGGLDCAFNNAGFESPTKPLHKQLIEDFDKVMATNTRGLFLCMKYEIQQMLSQGAGVIVNTSSTVGLIGFPGASPYVASKHAVMGLTRAAAMDYAKQGIRINAINPGGIATEGLDRILNQMDLTADELAAMVPMGRIAQAKEVAQTVVFLCSDAASYITGQPLLIDGGFTVS